MREGGSDGGKEGWRKGKERGREGTTDNNLQCVVVLGRDLIPLLSLHLSCCLVLWTSVGAMTPPPDYDTVYRILVEVSATFHAFTAFHSIHLPWQPSPPTSQREKDLELAGKIGRTLVKRNELLELELVGLVEVRQQMEQQVRMLVSIGT